MSAQQNFAMLKEFNSPKADQQWADASFMNQGDSYKRYVPALIEPGDCTFTLLYVKEDLARCYALQGVSKAYLLTFPDASTFAFNGKLQNAEVDGTIDAVMDIKCSLRVEGAVVFTPGS
jgi:hypothetical protein